LTANVYYCYPILTEARIGKQILVKSYNIKFSEEISKYKLDLVRVQEGRWDRGGTKPAGEHTFFY
jgi:hypothetical protein